MVEGKGVATGQPPHAESTGKQQEEGVRAWVVRHFFRALLQIPIRKSKQ